MTVLASGADRAVSAALQLLRNPDARGQGLLRRPPATNVADLDVADLAAMQRRPR